MKDELVGEIMKDFSVSRPKTYSRLTDYNDEDKKTEKHQKYVS